MYDNLYPKGRSDVDAIRRYEANQRGELALLQVGQRQDPTLTQRLEHDKTLFGLVPARLQLLSLIEFT
jgi:hypothetical protein